MTREATQSEGEEIFSMAETWYKSIGYKFADARMVAVSAVAEYIANQRGLTLFPEDK